MKLKPKKLSSKTGSGHWYRRNRYAHTLVSSPTQQLEVDGSLWDDYGGCCCAECMGYKHDDSDLVLSLSNIESALAIRGRTTPFQLVLPALPGAPEPLAEAPETETASRQAEELAQDIQAHCKHIAESDCSSEILEQLNDEEALVVGRMLNHLQDQPQRRDLALMVLFCPFWVRSPLTFPGAEKAFEAGGLNLGALGEHLFCLYSYPKSLRYCGWNASQDLWQELDWFAWFLLATQGGSVERAGKLFGWHFPRAVVANFTMMEHCWRPEQALELAWVQHCGGSQWEAEQLREQPGFFEPTSYFSRGWEEHHRQLEHFSAQTVQWLARNKQALNETSCRLILPWAVHRHAEAQAGRGVFTWSGRSVAQALTQAEEYQATRYNFTTNATWEPLGWDWSFRDEASGDTWTMTELTSSLALWEEGTAMSHCVGGYTHLCVHGSSAIFSMRNNDKRRITIEMEPRQRRIVQARGTANRDASAAEKQILNAWMQAILKPPA
jgi:hypothetical protein